MIRSWKKYGSSVSIGVLLVLVLVVLSIPSVLAGPTIETVGWISAPVVHTTAEAPTCGEESFLTRLVVGPIGSEGTLLWVGGAESSLLTVDRQGIIISQHTYNFGYVDEDEIVTTGLSYFAVTNLGEYTIDLVVSGEDLTGGVTWTLSDTCTPGVDTCGLKAGLEGGDYTVIVRKTAPYNVLKSSLGPGVSQNWGIKLYAPTTSSDYEEKTGKVTLIISIH